jgi:FERM domain-containing protein 3/5
MTLQTVQHTRMHLFGHDLNKTYKCTVRYLDDSSWETTYSKHEDSQKIFDRICNHINLIEKDYFGLRFIDETKQRKWLDLGKNARKQLKKAGREENVIVSFRVKFYPPDPMTRLNEELTRYQLFLQLRRDLQVKK